MLLGRLVLACCFAMGIILGCGSGGGGAVGGKILSRFSFDIDTRVPSRVVPARDLAGMQGSPQPIVPGDFPLTLAYSEQGIPFVRLPQDDFCRVSLQGVFPDPKAPASDPGSYDFSGIDRLIEGAIASGAQVVWQAGSDIGNPLACMVQGTRQAGQPVRDPLKHVQVAVNVLRHFKGDFGDGPGLDVRYVEYINDPMGLGGYDRAKPQPYFEDFRIFAQGVKASFPDDPERGPTVFVLAPAHRITSVEETDPDQRGPSRGFLPRFIDKVVADDLPLDILTLQVRFDDPYKMALVLRNIREVLDRAGRVQTPIWVTEVAPSEELVTKLRAGAPGLMSAFYGAHLTAAKIAWQGFAQRAFPHRGTRRFSGPGGEAPLESAYFTEDGTPRPAILPFVAFRKITGSAILDGSVVTSDGVAVLAVRDDAGSRIWLLVANEGSGAQGDAPLNFRFNFGEIAPDLTSFSWRAAIAEAVSEPVMRFSRGGTLPISKGRATLTQTLPTPSTLFVELSW